MDRRPVDTDEVAEIYDELLDTYERAWEYRGHRSLHLGLYDESHDEPGAASINAMRALSTAAEITAGERVLNIGCGAGEDSVWNAKAHDARVVGVDVGERQLAAAKENAREHGVADRTAFRTDDFHELATVADDSIDVVWGLEAIAHSPEPRRALKQARRVLDRNGRIAVADLFLTRELTAEERERLTSVNDGLGVRVGSIRAFRSALSDTGFDEVTIRERTAGVEPSLRRRSQFAGVAGPLSRALGAVGLGSERRRAAFEAYDQLNELVSAGAVGYFIVTATRGDDPTAEADSDDGDR